MKLEGEPMSHEKRPDIDTPKQDEEWEVKARLDAARKRGAEHRPFEGEEDEGENPGPYRGIDTLIERGESDAKPDQEDEKNAATRLELDEYDRELIARHQNEGGR
jgi:hypothetical protein